MKWEDELIRAGQEVVVRGGRVEFIVYKRGMKRKPVIHKYTDNEVNCDEVEIID